MLVLIVGVKVGVEFVLDERKEDEDDGGSLWVSRAFSPAEDFGDMDMDMDIDIEEDMDMDIDMEREEERIGDGAIRGVEGGRGGELTKEEEWTNDEEEEEGMESGKSSNPSSSSSIRIEAYDFSCCLGVSCCSLISCDEGRPAVLFPLSGPFLEGEEGAGWG